uniref:LRAT domain-containing protein n=1 Tax=Macrostomum lignano TaxID=282301 RepID=A0A1I8JGL7_9PLAT
SCSCSSSSGGYRSWVLKAYDEYASSQAHGHNASDFCDPESLVDHLQPGDLVQQKGSSIINFFYSHYAVYVGNGDVIHINESGPAERGRLVEVFHGTLVRKNNLHDDHLPPKPRPQIPGCTSIWDYNAATNNCEHFATLCRYGQKISLHFLGVGDLWRGRVGLGNYARNAFNSAKQACSTLLSWGKRKIVGAVTG